MFLFKHNNTRACGWAIRKSEENHRAGLVTHKYGRACPIHVRNLPVCVFKISVFEDMAVSILFAYKKGALAGYRLTGR